MVTTRQICRRGVPELHASLQVAHMFPRWLRNADIDKRSGRCVTSRTSKNIADAHLAARENHWITICQLSEDDEQISYGSVQSIITDVCLTSLCQNRFPLTKKRLGFQLQKILMILLAFKTLWKLCMGFWEDVVKFWQNLMQIL